MIEVSKVSKSFHENCVVRDVTFRVQASEVVTLLGPNGAGKSTLFSMVSGLRAPDRGQVLIEGLACRSVEARECFRLSPQDCDFPKHLKASQVFQYAIGFGSEEWRDLVIDRFQIKSFWESAVGGLSGGQRRRLSLAIAFAGRPRFVLLDEPSAGLDLESRRSLWDFIRMYRSQGGGCLLTTHHLDEAEALSDRVVVLKSGTVLFEGTVDALRGKTSNLQVKFRCDERPQIAGCALSSEGEWTILTRDSDQVVRNLVNANLPFRGLRIEAASIEECLMGMLR